MTGIEHILDLAHQGYLDRILQIQEVLHLGPAQTVFTGDRAAKLHRCREDVVQQPVPDVVVGAELSPVHVAVTGVPASDHATVGSQRENPLPGW